MTTLTLPAPAELRRRCKALAMAEAILCPTWEYRYYSYNAAWNEGEEMASMRDGEGSEYFFWFAEDGCALKVFAKESPLSKAEREVLFPEVEAAVPAEYAAFFAEPAFTIADSTALSWFDNTLQKWQVYGDLASASELLHLVLGGTAQAYQVWAENYYEIDINLPALEHVFALNPLDENIVQQLNPELLLTDLEGDLNEIDFPVKN